MTESQGRVAGKVALVTGGAGGIGQAIARRLAQEGATVTIADLDAASGEAAVNALARQGVSAQFMALDVRDENGWCAVVERIVADHQRLDIVVNNAGIALPPPESFESLSLADWRRIMDVNLDGAFLGTREAVRAMKAQGGSIINIGSVAAYIGTPGGAAYGASKGGLRSMTKQAAVACARKGLRIRINAVHPCYVWTPLAEKAATARFGADQAQQGMRDMHPFGCLGEPDDVANAVLFLASDESRLVNGTDLIVDGALLAT